MWVLIKRLALLLPILITIVGYKVYQDKVTTQEANLRELRQQIYEQQIDKLGETTPSEPVNTAPPPTFEVKEVTKVEVVEEKAYVPPVDPNPIISCNKGKCGTKSLRKSECENSVCCEYKEGAYKWTNSKAECDLLKAENARQPITLPHNSELYYCDKSSHSAIKQASENITNAKNAMNDCMNDWTECEERSNDKYMQCNDTCNPSLDNYQQCVSTCNDIRRFSLTACGSSADCITSDAFSSSTLEELINKYCD